MGIPLITDYLPKGQYRWVANLGAGLCASPVSEQVLSFPCERMVNVDVFGPYLFELQRKKFAAKETAFVRKDIRAWLADELLMSGKYDVVFMIDVLEHLPKEDGITFLSELGLITNMVLIWLPLGVCVQEPYDNNPHQKHLSTWVADDFTLAPWHSQVHVLPAFHTHFDPPVDAAFVVINYEN